MKLRTLIVFMILMVGANCPGMADDTIPPSAELDFGKYAKMSRPELFQSLKEADAARLAMSEQVIRALSEDQPAQSRLAAIVIAGLFRLDHTAPSLAQMIDFDDPGVETDSAARMLYGYEPVSMALYNIRNPAIPWLIENLARSDNEKIRRRSAETMLNILNAAPAKARLQESIDAQAAAKNATAVARLKAALPLFNEAK